MRFSPQRPLVRSIFQMFAVICAASSMWTASPALAQGDVLVAPTRVILDGRRGTEVILSNIGAEEATYRISLELRRMTEDGSLIDVAEESINATETAALEMIRYAPRRISLPPGQPQSVRIAARPGADLPDGEYRVHMMFRAIPKPLPATESEGEAAGISIRLVPIYGISIPIIVRHGKVEAQAALYNPRVVESEHGPILNLNIAREGLSSTYGALRVTSEGGERIFEAKGVAVYPEISGRSASFRLTPEQAGAMTGRLRFEYREMPEAGGGLIAALDTVL